MAGDHTASYKKDLWLGISSVTDEIPGFEVALAEEDVRLYRLAGMYYNHHVN